ncbi:5093_t:CDS:2, partial [Acaulospora colombiana]
MAVSKNILAILLLSVLLYAALGEANYTVKLIAGALVNKDKPDEIFRNLTSSPYSALVPAMDHIDIKYTFYSEFPTQELGLVLFVFFTDEENNQFRGVGFNDTVTVVEPEQSLFDLQLLFLYVILSGIIFGIGYMIFQAFFGGTRPRKGRKRPPVSKPEDQATGASSSSDLKYDESWIPEHNLRSPAARNSSRIKKKTEK